MDRITDTSKGYYESPRNEWTDDNEQIIKHKGDRHGAYVWLYNETANYYETWNTALTIFNNISIYILGSSGIPTLFIGTSLDLMDTLKWVILALQITLICVGAIATVQAALRLTKKIGKARWTSGKNASIFTDIKKQLSLARSHRKPYDEFHEEIAEMESRLGKKLSEKSLDIPNYVLDKYFKIMGPRALTKEELFDEQMAIKIEHDPKHMHPIPPIIIAQTEKDKNLGPAPSDVFSGSLTSRPVHTSRESMETIDLSSKELPTSVLKQKGLNNRQIFELEKYFID